jgi:hypothetical protein
MPNRLYACHVYEKNEKQEFDLYCIIRLLYVYRVGRHRYHYTPACQKGSVGGKRSRFTVKSLVNTHQRVVEGEEAKQSQGEINSMVFSSSVPKNIKGKMGKETNTRGRPNPII